MKKKYLIIVFTILVLLGYRNKVEALNVVREVDGITYTITTVSDLDVCKVSDTKIITSNYAYNVNGVIGIVDERYAVFYDSSSKEFYTKDLIKNECKKVDSADEEKLLINMNLLYIRSEGSGPIFEIRSNGDVFQGWGHRHLSIRNQFGYYLTKDQQLVEDRYYYKNIEGEMTRVENKDVNDIGSYYELSRFVFYPTIDSSKTYYKKNENSEIFEEVINPIKDDILLYRIKEEIGADYKIAHLDLTKFPKDLIFIDGRSYATVIKVGNEKKYILNDGEDDIIIYNEDGTIFKKIKPSVESYEYGESGVIGGINGTMLYVSYSYKYLLDSKGNNIFDFSKDKNGNYVSKECDIDVKLQGELYLDSGLNDGLGITESTVLYVLRDNYNVYFGPKALKVTAYFPKKGNNQSFNKEDLTFTFSGELELLSKVILNDEELDKSHYTTKSGSTIITINKDYLATLKSGNYTLKVQYNDGGYTSADFIVPESNPKTFDSIVINFIITIISVVGIVSIFLYKKRYS